MKAGDDTLSKSVVKTSNFRCYPDCDRLCSCLRFPIFQVVWEAEEREGLFQGSGQPASPSERPPLVLDFWNHSWLDQPFNGL